MRQTTARRSLETPQDVTDEPSQAVHNRDYLLSMVRSVEHKNLVSSCWMNASEFRHLLLEPLELTGVPVG
ncbi:MAG: hypothetical protein RIG62_20020 [Cyclobacteriaceae bacterium]